jgi:2'-hydroxyisoflavone reductase
MKILIIGGTQFIGRHMVDEARARGHDVTLFNRGKTNRDLFPDVEKLHGNRDGELDALCGRTWDVVIDNCGYVPRVVKQSAQLLQNQVERYIFISSISAYADLNTPGTDEESPLATLADESVEEVNGETYGGLKVLCERVATDIFADRALIIRPGLIVGPHDPTHRFTYWPVRVADEARCNGEVLAPDSPEVGTQIIDGRDLSRWTITMVERSATGVYNVTGPDNRLTFGTLLDTCKSVANTDVHFTWVSEAFLLEHGVTPWQDIPCWVPHEVAGFDKVDIRKAIGAGLTFRPLADTVRDTLAWENARRQQAGDDDAQSKRAGLTAEREAEVLAAWHARA